MSDSLFDKNWQNTIIEYSDCWQKILKKFHNLTDINVYLISSVMLDYKRTLVLIGRGANKKYSHLQKKNRNSMGLSHGIYQIQNQVESHYYNHYEKWALVINYHSLIMLIKTTLKSTNHEARKKQSCNCQSREDFKG